MRILLATAVAIAPLMVAAGAQAEQVISNGRTTPISTSTANNGARDDVRIANGGSIAVTSGAAVTLDSSKQRQTRRRLQDRHAEGRRRRHGHTRQRRQHRRHHHRRPHHHHRCDRRI
nr:hypothetical protein [Enterobacter roggenkampii]